MMPSERLEQYLLQDLLRQVSRSFYLTLAVLPRAVVKQVGLAYLFARAADTIADTGQADRNDRITLLHALKRQFLRDRPDWDEIGAIQARAPRQRHHGERTLLDHLASCFQMYQGLTADDRAAIRRVLPILISGMEMDVDRFPGGSESQITALASMEELDEYIYKVAGCVGEFWTDLTWAHLPRLRWSWDRDAKRRIGVRFGKGLQLTNILKDLPGDLRRGRCYVPLEFLEPAGLQPGDLLEKGAMTKFRPILHQLVGITLAHLDQGWVYTASVPGLEVRLRLACTWPILIALKTLRLLTTCDNVLDPAHPLKISRGEVYRLIAATTMTGAGRFIGAAYWGHVRKAMG